MSEKKNVNKSESGKYRKKSRSRIGWVLVLLAAALIVGGLVLYMGKDTTDTVKITVPSTVPGATETEQADATAAGDDGQKINLGYGIYVTDMGPYTGVFMEDGTDEILSNILMIIVRNDGDQDIQLAEISMQIGDQKAQFTLTSLPVGKQMVLLEKNRMTWDDAVDYSLIYPMVDNIAFFQEPVSCQEDRLEIGILDGILNVKNISGEDISGNIAVYYKNAADDLYYGGITYRVTLEGGLKNNEIRQIVTNHASESGTEIVFVTVAE